MKIDINNYEYNEIIKDIINNREFKKIEAYPHHKINRLEHSKRVSYYSYKVSKILNLDYIASARAGLLHDFFLNKYNKKNLNKLLVNHPLIAAKNAQKHFKLSPKEINIIESHMFPVSLKRLPKYKESLVVGTIDKLACIYEKTSGYTKEINYNLGKTLIYVFLYINS